MEAHATEPRTVPASRQPVGITATKIKAEFLDPSMEATCWNLRQFNPSPEIDSDLEFALKEIRARNFEQAERWVLAAIAANHREGQENLRINGAADQLAEELERRVIGAALGIKAICRRLRPILKAIDSGSPAEASEALMSFQVLRREVPNLDSPGVRRELGKRLTSVLEGLL